MPMTKDEKKTYNKKYREEHKEEIKAQNKKYNEEHKEEIKAQKKKYNEEHKEEIKAQKKKYREEHKEEIKDQKKKYYKCLKKSNCPLAGQHAQTMTFTCEVCGKEFRRLKSSVDWIYEHIGGMPRFCCKDCYYISKKKGYKSPYAKRIEQIKKEVGM